MPLLSLRPFGFEDGQILGYRADTSRLELDFEFWNAKRGTIVFHGFVGMQDHASIEVTIGSASEQMESPLIEKLIELQFEGRPDNLRWTHVQFFDVLGHPRLDVVAESCEFKL